MKGHIAVPAVETNFSACFGQTRIDFMSGIFVDSQAVMVQERLLALDAEETKGFTLCGVGGLG
jgi:hypothetical protein